VKLHFIRRVSRSGYASAVAVSVLATFTTTWLLWGRPRIVGLYPLRFGIRMTHPESPEDRGVYHCFRELHRPLTPAGLDGRSWCFHSRPWGQECYSDKE
jgi:hypothetical protein